MDATQQATERVASRYQHLLASLYDDWPLYVAALVIVLIAIFLAALVGRIKLPSRLRPNEFVAALINGAVRAVILLVGFVIALDLIGATAVLGSVLGAAGVAGVAIGFAVRDVLENYLAGLLLSLRRPFTINDLVMIDGNEGTVLRLTPRSTILLGLDGNHIRIPNATVFKTVIVNFTQEPKRRFSFNVGIDVDADLVATRDLVLGTLRGMEGILDDPSPLCNVDSIGDSNMVLFVGGWMDQSTHDFGRIRSEAIRLVKETLDEALIAMPEPIFNVRLTSADTAPEALPDRPAPAPRKPSRPAEETRANTERERVARAAADDGSENLLSNAAPKE